MSKPTVLFEITGNNGRTSLALQSNGLVIAQFKKAGEESSFTQQVQIDGALFRSFVVGCSEHADQVTS